MFFPLSRAKWIISFHLSTAKCIRCFPLLREKCNTFFSRSWEKWIVIFHWLTAKCFTCFPLLREKCNTFFFPGQGKNAICFFPCQEKKSILICPGIVPEFSAPECFVQNKSWPIWLYIKSIVTMLSISVKLILHQEVQEKR